MTILSTTFPYEILYSSNRNAYIKISDKGTVIFSIPKRYKHDQAFFSQLFEKAQPLRSRYQQRPKLEKQNAEGLQLFGEWVARSDFLDSSSSTPASSAKTLPSQAALEKKLKAILYEYAKERIDIFAQKLQTPYQQLSIRKAKSKL